MRPGWLLIVLAVMSASRGVGQEQRTETNAMPLRTSAASLQDRPQVVLRPLDLSSSGSSERVIVKRKLRISGPLVRPFKAKTGSEFSKRVVHLFSPFASEDSSTQAEPSGPVSSRAWSTMVGWNPGRSAFPDDTWHEPQLRLISINVEKQP
jgi:hypothetical protein